MELHGLETILSEISGNKFCPICGTPFEPYNSRQITCGAPDCKRQWHNQYMRERTKRQREEDLEGWRKYHREAVRKNREKKREARRRESQLKRLSEQWEKQADFDRKVSEYGLQYGEGQRQKILATVPKINVNLGGHHDDIHDKDSRERSGRGSEGK